MRKFSNVGLPKNLLLAIGHVAALWAQIEYTIDSKISEALALPGAPKINPKLIIPFNQRLQLLDQLCKQFLTDPENRKFAAKIVSELKQLIGLRNLIVHGAVRHSKQRRKRHVVYWFRRIAWDNPARIIEKRAMTVAEVEIFAHRLSNGFASAGMFEVFFWSVERALLGKAGQ
jgi:hypothetical protein